MCVQFYLDFVFHCFRTISMQVKPVLDRLNGDTDVDVKFFASEAIAGIAGKSLFDSNIFIYVLTLKFCNFYPVDDILYCVCTNL